MSRNARKFRRKHPPWSTPSNRFLSETWTPEKGCTAPPSVFQESDHHAGHTITNQRSVMVTDGLIPLPPVSEKMRERLGGYFRAHPETRYALQSMSASKQHATEWKAFLDTLGPLATVLDDSIVFDVHEADKPGRIEDLKAIMELVGPPSTDDLCVDPTENRSAPMTTIEMQTPVFVIKPMFFERAAAIVIGRLGERYIVAVQTPIETNHGPTTGFVVDRDQLEVMP